MRSSSIHTRNTLGSCYDTLNDLLDDRDECERLICEGGTRDQMKRRLYWIKHYKYFEAIIKRYPDLHHDIPEEERGSLSAELQELVCKRRRTSKIDSERLVLSTYADDEDLLASSEDDDDLDDFIVDDVEEDAEYQASESESESDDSSSEEEAYDKQGRRIYQIDRILQRRSGSDGDEYLIRWEGYGPKHDSWEPDENIFDRALVDSFNRSQERKSKRSSGCICSIYRN